MQVNIKLNYIVFSVITLLISLVSKFYTSLGMQWYYTLHLPYYTPPSWIIGTIWTTIYVLSTIAIIMVWNNFVHDKQFYGILLLFFINAAFCVLWTYLFFHYHSFSLAFIDALAVCISLLALIIAICQRSLCIAALLTPYLAWITYAIWLHILVWIMN